jgi:HSP20 family protein
MTNVIVRPHRNGLNRVFDRMFSDFVNFPTEFSGEVQYRPRVDIKETKDDVQLTFEVPGINKEDIKVVLENRVLTVSGKREFHHEDDYVLNEINSGSFCRSFTLPDTIDSEKISADYKNGMLSVKLAKVEEKKPKEIQVTVS